MFISGISGGTQSLGGIGHQSSNFVKGPVPFSFVLVGGGGGAGVRYTGGGGAGALVVGTGGPIAPGTVVTLLIGAGAAATNVSPGPSCAAFNSYHGTLTQSCGFTFASLAMGGSGAKGRLAYTSCQGSCGGSGGGGGGSPPGPSTGTVPPNPQFSGWGVSGCVFGGPVSPNGIWTLYGNPGGNFFGGGGGAGGAGVSRLCKSSLNSTRTTDGAGGAGKCLPGWGPGGSGIVLAGGGGGGGLVAAVPCAPSRFVGGAPGPGGGGAGGGYGQPVVSQSGGGGTNAGTPTWVYPSNVTLPTAGTYGTGGGGGGSLYVASGPNSGSTIGSGGGSGTFMLKVPTPLIGTAVVPPSAPPIGLQTWPDGAGNTVFKFNTSGTYTF